MTDSFDVVTGDLVNHASTLNDLAGQLNTALDTARSTDLTPDAFGTTGQGFVPAVQSVTTAGQDALRTQVAALETATTDMRTTAANYQQQDDDTGSKLSAIGNGLPQQTTTTAPQTNGIILVADTTTTQPTAPLTTPSTVTTGGDGTGQTSIPAPGSKPGDVAGWWGSLSQDQKQQITDQNPQQIGALDGVPAAARDYANRKILPDLITQTQGQLDDLKANPPQFDSANPGSVDSNGVSEAQAKYSNDFLNWNNQVNQTQAKLGGLQTIDKVIGPAQPFPSSDIPAPVATADGSPQKFLLGVDTNDYGHAIIASNNPDASQNVATVVPGMNTRIDELNVNWYTQRMDQMVGAATAAGGPSTSTIAWMNYTAPQEPWVNGISSVPAQNGAPGLIQFQQGLDATHGSADSLMTWVPHSYGTDVVGQAALMTPGGLGTLGVTNVVVLGSPGMDVSKAADLGVQHVFAAQATNDIIQLSPPFHGPSPVAPSFGAQVMDAGQGASGMFYPDYRAGHDSYFDLNSPALANMGNIITGHYNQVTAPPEPQPIPIAIPP